jgi:energy-coupling factor transporter ATP-binding protein EcfA2
MRLVSAEVLNYKGIRRARLEDMGDLPVVVISGRNGTGKSLLLEAIVGAWSGRSGQFPARIGPWANESVVDLTVGFTQPELDAIEGWHEQTEGVPVPRGGVYRLRQTWHASGSGGADVQDSVVRVVRQGHFQRLHPFAVMDFLSSTRVLSLGGPPTIDLPMLTPDRLEQERSNMLDAAIVQRSLVSMPSVANFLATLDYQALLAGREGQEPSGDYELIAGTLRSATGKTLLLPRTSPTEGSVIEVELPDGHRHALSDLSTGEQETLALAYFARRLSASGGILCLDEPEQHLHPTLQAAIFAGLRGIAERAQVLVVSHSVNLIVSAPTEALFQVSAAEESDVNQVSRVRDEAARVQLVGDLGVSPADLLQSDMLVVVEGETDSRILRALFPLEFGRVHVLVAGGGKAVQSAYDTLVETPLNVPWLCVMDRDLMSAEEVEESKQARPRLHIWPRREIESMLLEPALLGAVLSGVQPDFSSDPSELLAAAAAPLLEDVCEAQVLRELARRVPSPAAAQGSRFEKVQAHLRADSEVFLARADLVDTVAAEVRAKLESDWADTWPVLADPKVILSRLQAAVSIFRDSGALLDALVAKAKDDAGLRPAGLEDLRSEIATALGVADVTGSVNDEQH